MRTADDFAEEFGFLMDRAVSSAKSHVADDLPLSALRRLWLSHEIVVLAWPGTTERGRGHYRMIVKGAGLVRGVVHTGKVWHAALPLDPRWR
jgi:hypothetical protein